MSDTLKAVCIGLGVMGRNHYRILSSLPGVQVTGLCDIAPSRSYEEPLYDSIEKLLEHEKPDCAVIAVPTPAHAHVAQACIAAGVHVLIEKPVASSVEQADKIRNLAEKAGIRSAVGHTERFNPVVDTLIQELEHKDIYSITINRTGPLPPRISDVGILSDLAVHDIDLISHISREPFVKTNIFSSQHLHYHHEDCAHLSFKLGKEILASITTNWLTPFKKRTIEVATKNAYFVADLMSQELTEYCASPDDDEYVKSRSCFVRKGEPLVREWEAFISYLATGERGNLASIEDSIFTLQTLSENT